MSQSEHPLENSAIDIEQWTVFTKLADNPIKLLLHGGKFGVRNAGKFGIVILLFAITNLFLFGFVLYRLFAYSYSHQELGWTLAAMLLGIIITIYAGYRMYFVVLTDMAKFIYSHSTPLFQEICATIVDHSSELYTKKIDADGKKLAHVIDFSTLLSEQYDNRCPRLIKRGILFLLTQIPVIEMLVGIKEVIADGERDQAKKILFQSIDRYLHKSIFNANNIHFIYWLLPINFVGVTTIGMILIQ